MTGGSGNGDKYIKLPKWFLGLIAGGMTIVVTAMLSWAVNIDTTQRDVLQDVSALKENRQYVADQLERIENKLDSLSEIDKKLDKLISRGR